MRSVKRVAKTLPQSLTFPATFAEKQQILYIQFFEEEYFHYLGSF